MISYKDQNIKRQIIMKKYTKPNYFVESPDDEIKKLPSFHQASSSCVDDIDVYVDIKEEKINNIYWTGQGCAILKSSVELVIDKAINKTKLEIKSLMEDYMNMLDMKEGDYNHLGELQVFDNVKTHLNRYECAKIVYKVFLKIAE